MNTVTVKFAALIKLVPGAAALVDELKSLS
jgi:hypothetical protein